MGSKGTEYSPYFVDTIPMLVGFTTSIRNVLDLHDLRLSCHIALACHDITETQLTHSSNQMYIFYISSMFWEILIRSFHSWFSCQKFLYNFISTDAYLIFVIGWRILITEIAFYVLYGCFECVLLFYLQHCACTKARVSDSPSANKPFDRSIYTPLVTCVSISQTL